MSSQNKIWQSPEFDDDVDVLDDEIHHLILHNDDFNTFNHVIESLVDVCHHDVLQAEQCAFIVHFKGKCDVKNGAFDVLHPLKDKLTSKGLSVTID
jgi:ATP-dependent Clp protease adaptor protein ClpS